MTRDPAPATRPRILEDIAAEVPESLRDAEMLLIRYGKWATVRGGNRCDTVDRQYIREADRRETLEAFERRREEAYNAAKRKEILMPTPEALNVQRAIARVPDRERIVLSILYIPRKVPAYVQLQTLRIPPKLSRMRHLAGLTMFRNIHRVVCLERG